jgi:hypothetical protein
MLGAPHLYDTFVLDNRHDLLNCIQRCNILLDMFHYYVKTFFLSDKGEECSPPSSILSHTNNISTLFHKQ